MAQIFKFPKSLTSLEQEQQDPTHFSAQTPISIPTLSQPDLDHFVKGVSFDLSDKDLVCVEEQDVFDRIYSLVKYFNELSNGCKLNIVESLRSNFSVLLPNIDSLFRASGEGEREGEDVLERVGSYRNAFKIYTFFLVNVVVAQEGASGAGNAAKVMICLFVYF